MKRLPVILAFLMWCVSASAQVDTRIVDSLQDALATQQGRDKVLTMIELTWDFYDVSFDDCIDWGEKAIEEAKRLEQKDLEAKANYVLGIQYAHHADLDLAKDYLRKSYAQYEALADTVSMFDAMWSLAFYEMSLGSMDTAAAAYGKAYELAERLDDSASMAYVFSNLGFIHHQKNEVNEALEYYLKVKRFFEGKTTEEHMAMQAESNIATIYYENGRWDEAYKTFVDLIPKLEAQEDNYLLMTAYMNLGTIYERERVNYDSAMYCFRKGLECADGGYHMLNVQNRMRMLKSDILSDMAHLHYEQGDADAALKGYAEALELAERESHLSGQMTACVGLATLYAAAGQASKSMYYIDRYKALEEKSGIIMMRTAVRLPLVLNYARLGRYDALESELRNMDDERAALVRENADLHDRNRELEETVGNLVERVERQDALDTVQQTQLRQYRMAFFGLLALVLAALIFAALYKIVRKNREKNVKS